MTSTLCRLLLCQQCLSCRLFVFHSGDSLADLDIERVVPLGNGNGADAVTDQVGRRPRVVQEPVNAQESKRFAYTIAATARGVIVAREIER